MTRTNIDIDDELIQNAMNWFGVNTKREAVEIALRRSVPKPMTDEEALAMRGRGWEGDLSEMRDSYPIEEIWPDRGVSES